MDYALPRADQLPFFRLTRQKSVCPGNPLGVKGAGESGTIGAPAAVVNAVVDALWHLGVEHIDMPLTPERAWRAIHASEAVPSGASRITQPAHGRLARPSAAA